MDKTQALEKLRSIGQQHLFDSLENIPQRILDQIEGINIPTFRLQQQMLSSQTEHPLRLLDPFRDYTEKGNPEDVAKGKQLIEDGKVGCLLIAGGQGTRLKINGPKGMYPVTLFKKKSLFQLFAEKVIAARKQAGRSLPLAIMTSKQNDTETRAFFKENQFFGLDQVDFFVQEELPLLDQSGNLFLENPECLAMGPDGNGFSLAHFYSSGIWDRWYEEGIRLLTYTLIDNPLADPFDAELVGHHANQAADVIVKCSFRHNPNEKVGILVKHEDKVKVVEYSELPEEEKVATDDKGELKHRLANLSLFSFSMDFIKKISKTELPLHLAHKAASVMGTTALPSEPNAWKFETFIFDVLPYALKVCALLYPREECFAPLKNAIGDASLETVQSALLNRDKSIISELTGNPPPDFLIELAQEFYYPTEELRASWNGKTIEEEGFIAYNGNKNR